MDTVAEAKAEGELLHHSEMACSAMAGISADWHCAHLHHSH